MEKSTVIYSFSKGNGEEVRVSAGEFRDKLYFDLRVFYKDEKTDAMRPTKKGLTLAVDYLAELRKGLQNIEPRALREKNRSL